MSNISHCKRLSLVKELWLYEYEVIYRFIRDKSAFRWGNKISFPVNYRTCILICMLYTRVKKELQTFNNLGRFKPAIRARFYPFNVKSTISDLSLKRMSHTCSPKIIIFAFKFYVYRKKFQRNFRAFIVQMYTIYSLTISSIIIFYALEPYTSWL